MAVGKKKPTRLPRLTVLSMSRAELVRFSAACERVANLAHVMVGLMTRLNVAVDRLEARSAAAKKAHATRPRSAAELHQVDAGDGPAADQLPPAFE